MEHTIKSKHGLNTTFNATPATEIWNLPTAQLYEHAIKNGEGEIAEGGAFVTTTGEHTGRSANDKFIVKDTTTATTVDWGKVNKPMTEEHFNQLLEKAQSHYSGKTAYVRDMFAGADKDHRINVRVVTETAWHNMFARNMFIQPSMVELQAFTPEYTVIHAPSLTADPATDGTSSGTFVVLNFTQKIILIGGTSYAGEIKKSIFSVLNYLLPEQGILPMHCSANVGDNNDAAIFFGLSGTGKTTLSADSSRCLIGDDEHGWADGSVFNFEGGCYAKVIRLSKKDEPEIYATTRRFGTILENVVMDETTRTLDLDDNRHTENTRASYPISFIPHASDSGLVKAEPKNVIMLTADAFGVLPPIAKLTPEQAMYHFISGYTAKIAGTEKGLGDEPVATFSACFGAPFMARHPMEYGELLAKKIEESGADCWLVNTGWTGGAYGTGKRMSLPHTRALIHGALDGTLADVDFTEEPVFGLLVPTSCPDVPAEILMPRNTWVDKTAYDETAAKVKNMFEDNFKQFESEKKPVAAAV